MDETPNAQEMPTTPETPPIIPEPIEAPVETPVAPPPPVTTPAPAPETPDMQFVPKPPPGPPPKPRRSAMGVIVNIFLLIILFGVGIWLSSIIRQYLPKNIANKLPGSTPAPTANISQATTPTEINPFANWISYQVHNGNTHQVIPGITYKLPPDVLAPVCDGSNCPSEGTYLPGGTRLTIAYRGPGQVLRDFRGAVITDLSGKAFDTTQTTILGHEALEYKGTFIGTTVAGYSFSQMHGVMIEINETNSLEVNHFVPYGITADFNADDSLFTQILANLILSTAAVNKGTVIASPTAQPTLFATPTAAPTANPSLPAASPTLNYLY